MLEFMPGETKFNREKQQPLSSLIALDETLLVNVRVCNWTESNRMEQVIGYDARRRMHRCAYDATGEKQWHDLRTKRFEVVGQNGVILRSTESAPESASTPLLQASTSQ